MDEGYNLLSSFCESVLLNSYMTIRYNVYKYLHIYKYFRSRKYLCVFNSLTLYR